MVLGDREDVLEAQKVEVAAEQFEVLDEALARSAAFARNPSRQERGGNECSDKENGHKNRDGKDEDSESWAAFIKAR